MHSLRSSPLTLPTPSSPAPLDLHQRLLVPTAYLSQHEVQLPPTATHRLQAALAGALEEQLLDDPADLHFALSPTAQADMKAGQAIQVMVCSKAWLQGLLDQARAQGHHITSIVPDAAELQAAGWNLAQFEFRAQSNWSQRWQGAVRTVWQSGEWRMARLAMALLLLIHIVGANVWAWRDRAALQTKHEQVHRLLTTSFPETKVIVDAPAQMTRAVAALRSHAGQLKEKDLESLLAASMTNAQASRAPIVQIDYANGELKTQTRAAP